jgi:2-phosphosulfolactate phosphatase
MNCHIIEGAPGCAYAVGNKCIAVVVDALRASAMAAYLLHLGAKEIIAVAEVDQAYAAHERYPDALLAGERGGLPPEGFALGNSPRQIGDVSERRIIFTTTTGAGRLVACYGAPAVYMGTTVNASAVAKASNSHARDIVLIPAGLMDDPEFDAQEDWVAATVIAAAIGLPIGEGRERYNHWRERIEKYGVEHLFATAPHSEKLRRVGLDADIPFCAQIDTVRTVPKVLGRNDFGVTVGGT